MIIAALLWLMVAPAGVRADADPASDVLLGESVFYPYSPPVSQAIQNQLNAEVAAAGRAHFPIKVALIASPVDLGAIPNLFGKPQSYASFLDQEISFQGGKQPLLVVMSAGYGVAGLPQPAMAAAGSLPKPTGAQGDDLAQAASVAVSRLAAAAGARVSTSGQTSDGAGSSTALTVAIVAVVAVLAAGAILLVRRRRLANPAARRLTAPTRARSAPAGSRRRGRRRQR